MKKLKIFVTRNAWQHKDFGGAEVLAITLVKKMSQLGQDVHLVTGSGAMIEKANESKTPYILGPFSKRQVLTKHRAVFIPKYLYDLFSAYKSYLKLYRAHEPDIIHANGQQDSIAATAAAHKLNIPVVWSDHGELKNSLPLSIMPPFGIPGILLKTQSKKIKTLCMVNPVDISIVKDCLKNVLITKVPNGISIAKNNAIKTEYDLVFASRIIREKGIFETLAAFANIQKSRPHVTLLLSGDGPSMNDVNQYIKQNDLRNVTVTPYSDESIQKGKMFVLPTYTEAQSLAILKSMAVEVPIITTNIDGNTHFLEHLKTAYLVEPRETSSLQSAIVELLEKPKLARKLAIQAKIKYEDEYEIEQVIKKYYLPLYENYTTF